MSDMVPPGVRLGIVRSISYGLFGKPDQFVPQLRELGGTLVRVYFYWSQLEPESGRYTFEAVDAFLDQLDGSEEVWVTVCSSSRWATRQATDFLPPSPAKDPGAYRRFVDRLVHHRELGDVLGRGPGPQQADVGGLVVALPVPDPPGAVAHQAVHEPVVGLEVLGR